MMDIRVTESPDFVFRAYRNKYTREARGGQELYWQQKLKELDPELELRWNEKEHRWAIYYDHLNKLTCLRTFKPGDSFHEVYNYLRFNAQLDTRALRRLREEANLKVEIEQQKDIDEAAEEFAEELHHAARERVISDPTVMPRHYKDQ